MNKDFLKIDEAARLVGKSEVTIRRAIRANHFLVSKEETKSGFNYLIHRESLLKYYEMTPNQEGVSDKAADNAEPNQTTTQEPIQESEEETETTNQNKKTEENQLKNSDHAAYSPQWFSANLAAYFEKLSDPYKESLKILQEELKKRDEQIQVKDGQLAKKDEQIGILLERLREGNILLARTQNVELKAPNDERDSGPDISPVIDTKTSNQENLKAGDEIEIISQTPQEVKPAEASPKRKGFWKRVFGG